jgi:hypothetical protein
MPETAVADSATSRAGTATVTAPPSGGSRRRFVYLLIATAVLCALPWLPPIRDLLANSLGVLPAFGIREKGIEGPYVPLIGFAIEMVLAALAVTHPLLRKPFRLRTAAAREVIERQSRRLRLLGNLSFTILALTSLLLFEASLLYAVVSRRAWSTKEEMEPLANALLRAKRDGALPKLDLKELVPVQIERIPGSSAPYAGRVRALFGRQYAAHDAPPECVGFEVLIGRERGFTIDGGAWLIFLLGPSHDYILDNSEFSFWHPTTDSRWNEWTSVGDESTAATSGSWSRVEGD